MCVITGNYLRVYLRVLKQMYHCPPLSDTLRLSIRRIVIYFYVPDDDILFTNDMYIRGELDVMFDESNLPLSREEILNAIKQLKNNKGPGVDFTKGFNTWHKFSTEIRFMLIPIIVLFIAHEFITGKF